MLLRHKHRHARLWSPRTVPTGPMEVDWNHPLSGGLIGCYVPGGYAGLQDLTGIGPTLLADSGGTNLPTPEGYGYGCIRPSAAAYSTEFPDAWELSTGGTLFWRGVFLGSVSSSENNIIWGNVIAPNVQFPGSCYAIVGAFNQGLQFKYSSGSTSEAIPVPLTVSSNMQGLPVSIAVSFNIGPSAAVTCYVWDVITGSTPKENALVFAGTTWTGGSAPDYTQLPQPCIGSDLFSDVDGYSNTVTTSAYLYNRALDARQITMLNAAPFCMLRPSSRVLRNSVPTSGNPFRLRNRTYLIR